MMTLDACFSMSFGIKIPGVTDKRRRSRCLLATQSWRQLNASVMWSCSVTGDASRPAQTGLSSCSIPPKAILNLKGDSPRYPILVFGRTSSDDMATDRNNGAKGRVAIRLSRQSNAKPIGENVNQFAKNVAAVYGALDSKEFINATFRLLQTAAPGCFAWMMPRYSDSRGAVCISSNGLQVSDESAEHF